MASDLGLHCLPMSHKRRQSLYGLRHLVINRNKGISILPVTDNCSI